MVVMKYFSDSLAFSVYFTTVYSYKSERHIVVQ